MNIPPGIPKWGNYYFVDLEPDEIADLDRAVNGSGGFENFLRGIQGLVNHATHTVKLTETDIEELAHYAFDYKQGGWENRLLKIFGRALGPKLGRD